MGTYPVSEAVAAKRSAKHEASTRRREQFWAARWRNAQTPKDQAQVLYDRLRGVPRGGLPLVVSQQLWRVILDDLAALTRKVEALADQATEAQSAGRPPANSSGHFWG